MFASLIAIVSYGIVHITEALLHFRNELVEEADLEGWVVGVVLSLVYSLIPAILCLCQPAALGSGMLDVIGFLNGVSPKAHISWKILIVRIIGMLGAVSSGLFTGFDGPMVSVGCMIAVLTLKYATKIKSISNLLYRTTELDYTDNKASVWKIAHHKRARIYGSIGTAAAMAATFRSPIGGVVFALEETVSHYEGNGMLLKLLYASVTAYLIGATLQKGYGLNQIAYSLFAVSLVLFSFECDGSGFETHLLTQARMVSLSPIRIAKSVLRCEILPILLLWVSLLAFTERSTTAV